MRYPSNIQTPPGPVPLRGRTLILVYWPFAALTLNSSVSSSRDSCIEAPQVSGHFGGLVLYILVDTVEYIVLKSYPITR
ncbi:hypothetical protein BDV23DRAFT_148675 [Aspergillus alliaceus]|uniref:Uncharacterized protein n=1 Tax=Petromyces alliaceus TaxID=209559 RepID=A0A5N7CJA4_PETAA|nr:hypothetical protein BDV23DRAFT_148675 [Aspergillus alliaceus]